MIKNYYKTLKLNKKFYKSKKNDKLKPKILFNDKKNLSFSTYNIINIINFILSNYKNEYINKNYIKKKFFFCQLFLIFIITILTSTGSAFNIRQSNGLIQLCPPGGETFTNAWQMACGMRRKRRSVPIENKNNKKILTEQFRTLSL